MPVARMLDLEPAARQLAAVVQGVRDDQLAAPTPCEAYTVGDLLDHAMGLTIAFTDAAEKRASEITSQPPSPSARQLLPEWRDRIPAQAARLAAAWKTPAAWKGSAAAGREGLFGPVIALPAEAPLFDRALGLSGWDPAWKP